MKEQEVEIRPGTVFRHKDIIDPQTGLPDEKYKTYVVFDPLDGKGMYAAWLNKTGEFPKFTTLGGTAETDDIVCITGQMSLDEVLEAIKKGGWYSAGVEESVRECFSHPPRKIIINI